jgi:phosphoadenosine phosphosulfate reductase
MTDAERRMMLLHAKRSALDNAVERALSLIRVWLERAEKPYVAFSGGKDSSVLLHLVRQVDEDVPALFGDDEHLMPGTEVLLRNTHGLRRICGPTQHCEWYQSWAGGPDQTLPPSGIWVDSDPDEGSVVAYARERGFDGAAVGLRTGESGRRTVHLRSRGRLFYAKGKEVWQCYPLAEWSTRDVWGYIASRGVPYNDAYDRMAEAGIPLDKRRVGPFAPATALIPVLTNLRRAFPSEYRAFAAEYPEASQYT